MESFCAKCKEQREHGEVIKLVCSHIFCWKCIDEYLTDNLRSNYECPLPTCKRVIKDFEIREVLSPENIAIYERKCLQELKKKHECILPGCGFVICYDDKNVQYDCEKCTIYNCINCREAHKGMSCKELVSKNREPKYLVCEKEVKRAQEVLKKKTEELNRSDIVRVEKYILVPNYKIFNCQICNKVVSKNAGIIMRQCFHEICRECLTGHVHSCQSIPIKCPFDPCNFFLEDRECREILSKDDIKAFETKIKAHAVKLLKSPDKCRQVNCDYFLENDSKVKDWKCPSCLSYNCVACNAIHQGKTCKDYISSKKLTKDEEIIESMINEKKLMRCPKCKIILEKISGCDWVQCSGCQTELCWVNQTYRWGPNGPGDHSGGCKCNLNGRMCHPKCVGCTHYPCNIM